MSIQSDLMSEDSVKELAFRLREAGYERGVPVYPDDTSLSDIVLRWLHSHEKKMYVNAAPKHIDLDNIPESIEQENTATLRRIKYGVQVTLDKTADGRAYIEYVAARAMVVWLGRIWGEAEDVRRQEIKYPSDWWQAWKERFAPAWFLRKWPVKYVVEVMDVRAIYPTFRPKLPSEYPARLVVEKTWYKVGGQ